MNFGILATAAIEKIRYLRDEEEGLALTEYLILLGLLTAAVITAVGTFGSELGAAWGTWATWIADAAVDAPTTP